jgi:Ca2+-binding RTX toxin-like protein
MATSSTAITFIDASLPDLEQVVAQIDAGQTVHLIPAGTDGLAFIAATLAGQSNIDAIHIVSHGTAGALTLGNFTLTEAGISDRADDMAMIREAMAEDADILVYGCDLAAGEAGQSFVQALAEATGADIAASTDITGLGGDWDLEANTGPIEAQALSLADFNAALLTTNYTENSSAVQIDPNVTFAATGAGDNYSGGYLLIEGSGIASETLGFTQSGSANTTLNAISVVGTQVYRGLGGSAQVIGTVDGTLNGQNGADLRVNFIIGFTNGALDNGSAGSSTISGWTTGTTMVNMGSTQIAGWTTPVDSTYPAQNSTGDVASNTSPGSQSVTLSSEFGGYTGDLAIRLNTGSYSIGEPYGVIRGPYVYSNSTVVLQQGDSVSFAWKALSGGDAYDAYGYLLNVSTGATINLLDQTAADGGTSTDWATVSRTIGAGQAGEYRFVFIAGSFDASGGQYLGGELMIDDVNVTQANPPTVAAFDINELAQLATFSSSANDFAGNVTISYTAVPGTAGGATTSYTTTNTVAIVETNDAPSLTSNLSLGSALVGGSIQKTVSAFAAAAFSDPDSQYSPADSLSGIAVSSVSTSPANGEWSYSVDGGTTWTAFPAISAASSLVLSASTLVRFDAAAGFSGPATLSVRAIDSSWSGGYSTAGTYVSLDATSWASNSAFSQSAVTLSTTFDGLVSPTASITIADTTAVDDFTARTGTVSVTNVLSATRTLTYSIDGGTDQGNGTETLETEYGTLTLNKSTGAWSFNPNDDAINGLGQGAADSVSFGLIVGDGTGGAVTQTLTVNLTGADDPIVFEAGVGAEFFARGEAVEIAPALRLEDDGASLVGSVTVTLSGVQDNAFGTTYETLSLSQAALDAADAAGLTVSIVSGTSGSVLTLSGPATPAVYEAILNQIVYNNENPNAVVGLRSVDFVVRSTGGSVISTDSVPVEVAWAPWFDMNGPTGSGLSHEVTHVEGGPAVSIATSDAQILDQDGNIANLTVTLTNPLDNTGGAPVEFLSISAPVLALLASRGITVGTSDGALDVNGNLTGATTITFVAAGGRPSTSFQFALRGVQYTNTSDSPEPTDRIVLVNSVDMAGHTGLGGQTTIIIEGTNDVPVALSGSVTGAEDLDLVLSVSDFGFSSGADGGSEQLSAVLIDTLPSSGELLLNGVALTGPTEVTVADITAGLLVYRPAHDAFGNAVADVDFRVRDNSGASDGSDVSTTSGTLTIDLTATNDAPVLVATAPAALNGISEDVAGASNTGTTVADILSASGLSLSDVDVASGSEPQAIAVTGLDSTNGTWEFRLGSGAWVAVDTAALASGDALLLDAGDALRFVPDANFNGTLTDAVTFRAWDKTAGAAGDYVDVSANEGGSGSLSLGSGTASLDVASVADAPVLAGPIAVSLNEDASAAISGFTLADNDGDSLTVRITMPDADAGSLELQTTTGVTGTTSGTTLEFTGSIADVQTALNSLLFTAAADYNGSFDLELEVSDDAGATWQSYADIGGTPGAAALTVTVNPINDAPVLVATTSGDLTSILEDISLASNTGTTVADILSASGLSITDADVAPGSEAQAIAVTSLDTTHGTWQVKLAGGQWTAVDTASLQSGNALLLDATDALRFVPSLNFNGTIDDVMTFRAWDKTSGTAGSYVDLASNVGGTNSISLEEGAADVTVEGVEDAPFISGRASVTLNEDGSTTINGFTIGDGDGDDLTVRITMPDPDAGTLELQTTTGVTGTTSGTTLEFSGTIADLQAALNSLRFTAADDYNGSFDLQLEVSDDEGATWQPYTVSQTGQFFWAGNGHYYEYISASGIDWQDAATAASGRTLFGLQGYLATVTSAEENAFISPLLGGEGWIGASDAGTEGTWAWVTGPEAGTVFWQGLSNGSVQNGEYNNWGGGEPNNAGDEDYAHFLNNSRWNDYNFANNSIRGYVVEYGGLPGDNPVVQAAPLTINVTPINDAPQLASNDASITISEDAVNNAGQLVSDLLGSALSDVDTGTHSATNGTLEGIAVFAPEGGSGTFEYSLNGGTTWLSVSLAEGEALLLRATDLIRHVPNGQTGGTASFGYYGWDQSSGTAGSVVSGIVGAGNADNRGGSSAFSTDAATVSYTITDANDASTIVASSDAEFHARGPAVSVFEAGDVVLADVDGSVTLTQATVRLVAATAVDNLFGSWESLSFAQGTTITTTSGAVLTVTGTGTNLTISGAGSLADYTEALEGLRYNNTNPNMTVGEREIRITVTDDTGLSSSPVTVTVDAEWATVVDLNGVGAGRNHAVAYTEGSSGVAIAAASAELIDQDGITQTVTATLQDPLNGSAETLFIAPATVTQLFNTYGIVVTGNGTHALTMTAAAGLDPTFFQLALRTIQYANSSNNPGDAARHVLVETVDMDGNPGVSATTTINVSALNSAPTLGAIGATTPVVELSDASAQTVELSGSLTVTDEDVGETVSLSVSSATAVWSGGTLPAGVDIADLIDPETALTLGSVTATGSAQSVSWSYSAAADLDWLAQGQTLTLTFNVVADDGTDNSTSRPLVITITGTNDAPTAVALSSAVINENVGNGAARIVGTLTAEDPDVSDTGHSFAIASGDDGFFFEIVNGNQLKFRDGIALNAEAQSSYTVNVTTTDTNGASVTTQHVINIGDVNEFTVTTPVFDVTPIIVGMRPNLLPIVTADGAFIGIQAIANDADAGDDVVLYELVGNAGGGAYTAGIFSIEASGPDAGRIYLADASALTIGTAYDVFVRAVSSDGSSRISSIRVQATPSLVTLGDTAVNGEEAGDVPFVVAGLSAGASAVVTFSDGTNSVTVNVNSDGSYTADLGALTDGPVTVTVNTTNATGTQSGDVAVGEIDLDTTGPNTAPQATVTPPGTPGALPVVTISGLDANAGWEYSEDGGVTWITGSGSTFELSPSSQNPTLIRQVDEAGNGGSAITSIYQNDGQYTVVIGTDPADDLNGGTGDDDLNGQSDNDVMNGGAGNDTMHGGDGDDTLSGNQDDDLIYGGAGNDQVNGGVGNDTANGDAGDDSLYGGAGDDSLNGGDGNDSVDGGADNDTLSGGDGDDTLIGGTGNDSVTGDAGNDSLTGDDGNDALDGGTGNDTADGGTGDDTVDGGAGDDLLYGGDGNDSVNGGADNDTLWGGLGDDTLIGGTGNDSLSGDAGNDSLSGGDGNDTVDGGTGDDTLYGGAGDDLLYGGDGNDYVNGDADNDTLWGGLGDDTLIGGAGNDSLSGDAGNDVLSGDEGNDALDGGTGRDTLFGGAGNDTLLGNDDDDLIYGDSSNDQAYGGAGNDTLIGGTGSDTLYGGDGVDSLSGNENDDLIYGGDGNDYAHGNQDNDTLWGGRGDDTLIGGAGNDSVMGEDGTDLLQGWSGNDTLDGGAGNDILYGDGNNDLLFGREGNDWLDGGLDNDTIYGGLGNDSIMGAEGDDSLSGDENDDVIFGGDGNDYANGNQDNDTLYGGNGDDTMIGGLGNDAVMGDDGADSVRGWSGNDTVNGGAGNDLVFGDWGDDLLLGGDGDDYLHGAQDNDTISGGLGNDTLHGSVGNDSLLGNENDDQIFGGDGNDFVNGNDNNDALFGGNGDDTMIGGLGDDSVVGETGADNLRGGAGNDTILGGADNDLISGEQGNDVLSGGLGADTLNGGAGADVFVFARADVRNGVDLVEGFTRGTDQVGLSADLVTWLESRGGDAHDAISWNAATGTLSLDLTAVGLSGGIVEIARFSTTSAITLTDSDFIFL